MENESSLFLKLGKGKRMEMTPDNSTLYTFMGKTAIGSFEIENSVVNHVFVQTADREDGTASGMYFFREFDPDNYDIMAKHMVEHRFPMLTNLRNVPECDLRVWVARQDAEVARFSAEIPDGV